MDQFQDPKTSMECMFLLLLLVNLSYRDKEELTMATQLIMALLIIITTRQEVLGQEWTQYVHSRMGTTHMRII